jgi:ABC-type transport system involved in Fe-S cluster assembly fused permease/ATPase subunit
MKLEEVWFHINSAPLRFNIKSATGGMRLQITRGYYQLW